METIIAPLKLFYYSSFSGVRWGVLVSSLCKFNSLTRLKKTTTTQQFVQRESNVVCFPVVYDYCIAVHGHVIKYKSYTMHFQNVFVFIGNGMHVHSI